MGESYADLLCQLEGKLLPQHVAIIMDGNGRWAKRHGLPRSAGHRAGGEALRRVTELCREIDLPMLTVYAFSTENWRRSTEEVGFLMSLFVEYLKKEANLMNERNVKLGFIGKRDGLPPVVLKALDDALWSTRNNTALELNLAVNYGGRDELTRAARTLAARAAAGELSPDDITAELLSATLDTGLRPEPDLLIRPSGEQRLSNFLLWQSAYSELVFQDVLWPDYQKRDLLQAIITYQGRCRRFGGR